MPAPREDPDIGLLAAAVRRFLAANVDARAIDRDAKIPTPLIEGLAGAGLFALALPAEHGGLGLSMDGVCRIVEELAAVDRSIAIMVGLHAGLGTRGLVELGTPALKDAWLPRMARGEVIGAFAATESGAGSDLTHLATVAREAPGGALLLNGEKSYVTNGAIAGLFTVLARTPSLGGERACSLLVVPASSPGIAIGREEEKLGIRGSSTVTVRFDDVLVPRANVLGEAGRGADQAHDVLAWGRTIMAAGCVGTARAALDASLLHVRERRQFGRPIGDFGATRAHVVMMASRVLAMRALVRATAAAQAAGGALFRLSSAAKVYCSEGAFDVCDRAVQLHGATGFLEPHGIARMLRDCRVTRIFEGANDVLLVRLGAARVATRVVDAPLDVDDLPRPLAHMAAACRTLEVRVADAVAGARAKHGVTVVRRQTLLQRIARADVALLAALATLRDARPYDIALAEHTVAQLLLEADRHLDGIPLDDADEQRVTALSDALYGTHAPKAAASQHQVTP